jgi:hypothetical protein
MKKISVCPVGIVRGKPSQQRTWDCLALWQAKGVDPSALAKTRTISFGSEFT